MRRSEQKGVEESLFLAVLRKVDGDRDRDDDAFDDLLPHRGDIDKLQGRTGGTVKIRTPEMMPETLPTPPLSDTPPTTQAAMASKLVAVSVLVGGAAVLAASARRQSRRAARRE